MKNNLLPIIVGLVILGCAAKKQTHSDEISGIYVREYTFKVISPEGGAEIGMRSLRDTIIVRPIEDKFEVINHKWRKNDYDKEEWVNMEHSDDRPMPRYTCTYDREQEALVKDGGPALYFDSKHSNAYWNARAKYERVSP